MNTVKIEINHNSWTITVQINGNTFIEKHVATSTGAKCIEGNFDDIDMDDDLRESLQGFANYDIMIALSRI